MTGWRIAVKQVNLRNKAISFWPSEQKKRLSSSSPSLVDKRKTGFPRMGWMVPGGGPEPPQSFWPLRILSPTHSFSKLPILLQLQAFTLSSAMGSGGFYMVLHGANGQSLGRVGGVVGVMAIFRQLTSWNPHAFHKRADPHTGISELHEPYCEKALARPASVERGCVHAAFAAESTRINQTL